MAYYKTKLELQQDTIYSAFAFTERSPSSRNMHATFNIFISMRSLSNAIDDKTKSASAGVSPEELWIL